MMANNEKNYFNLLRSLGFDVKTVSVPAWERRQLREDSCERMREVAENHAIGLAAVDGKMRSL